MGTKFQFIQPQIHTLIQQRPPGSMLRHLMDARDLEEADLVPVLGTQKQVAEILMDQRAIQLDEARKLA